MTPPRSVLVVGAGLAGARCAETLRAEGFDGELVLVGEEPFAPYERPALSKEFLTGERAAEELFLRPNAFWHEQRIELVLGQRVAAVDRERRTATTSGGPCHSLGRARAGDGRACPSAPLRGSRRDARAADAR